MEHLAGDFAFVLWDGERRRLLAARDQLGVRTLFHAESGSALILGDSLDWIVGTSLAGRSIDREHDEQWIADFLTVGSSLDVERTVYRAVKRLAPAHLLEIAGAAVATRRYWHLELGEPLYLERGAAYVERFLELMSHAVGDRLPAGQVGISMSGGIDSTTLAACTIAASEETSRTLEATAEIVVAPKVGGRLDRITVDLGDPVRRGQVVAELDDDELAQAQAQTRADLAVAQARKVAADNALAIAERNLDRVAGLRGRGIATEEELDATSAAKLQAGAEVAVASSEITRAKAALRGAEVRKGYTQVSVDWSDGAETRVVAARHVDDGTMVAANTPLLSVVGLDPLVVVVHVTEQDYGRLHAGQAVSLVTDAYPGEEFTGHVARIAPVFAPQSRQARVELDVPNPDGRLRPGMFVRARVVLARVDAAAIVPRAALVPQDDRHAVYVVADDGATARLVPVTVGVSDGERVEVEGLPGSARVVTLGQAQLHDGAAIVLPQATAAGEGEPPP